MVLQWQGVGGVAPSSLLPPLPEGKWQSRGSRLRSRQIKPSLRSNGRGQTSSDLDTHGMERGENPWWNLS